MADPPDPEERDALAAELALGLLDGEVRAAALRLSLSDPAFAAEVERWGLRLSPLLAETPPETPPAHLWPAIAARTAGETAVVPLRGLRFWRAAAFVSTGIAAALALFVVLTPQTSVPAGPAPMALAQLTASDSAAVLAVAYDPGSGVMRIKVPAMDAKGKSPELWVIPAGGAPQSLGLIGKDGSIGAVAPGLRPMMREGAILAVTMEDGASAPHAAPTSAPVLSGKISTI